MDIKAFFTDKKNYPVIIIIICAVLVFLVFGGNEEKVSEETSLHPESEIERRLEMVLEKVEGAGKVSVFVSLEDYGATDYAKDLKEKVKETQTESEQTTVMKGSGSAAAPVVSRIASPKVKGVIVVAQGAKNEYVKENLASAVESALAIMPHRIKILEGNN